MEREFVLNDFNCQYFYFVYCTRLKIANPTVVRIPVIGTHIGVWKGIVFCSERSLTVTKDRLIKANTISMRKLVIAASDWIGKSEANSMTPIIATNVAGTGVRVTGQTWLKKLGSQPRRPIPNSTLLDMIICTSAPFKTASMLITAMVTPLPPVARATIADIGASLAASSSGVNTR